MDASVMLAAGGTGGHLFPAFALAQELGRRGIVVDLMTDMRGDRYGTGFPARTIHRVPSATLAGRSPVAAAHTSIMLARGTLAALRIIRRVKPLAVMGFGGYPTLPPLLAARLQHVPSAVHEQNAVLGRANRMLAKRMTTIATSFEHTKFLDGPLQSKARFTGNPVRDAVIAAATRPYTPPAADAPFTLVVFGGSQGARFFSEAVPPALAALPAAAKARLRVIQQCREEDLDEVRQAFAAAGIAAELAPFFSNLPERMAQAHLVIARAGASSVAEITVLGRPSILVPLPHALDNDQLQNATRLAESNGCWCIQQKDLTSARLGTEIASLMASPDTLAATAAAAGRQGRSDATARLADVIEELMGRKLPCQ
jgi:UDP-N-acetylglucosamine--N-acetylmuramyl-(pentapeptide) pyrophosphoryl-undecaprenol N-acetylglucosamine transferase